MKKTTDGTGCPCGECHPRSFAGSSWWKRLGFGSPTECAMKLREAGMANAVMWYRGNREW